MDANDETFRLGCELLGAWLAGATAAGVLVIAAVDRLLARVGRLEDRLEDASRGAAAAPDAPGPDPAAGVPGGGRAC